MKRTAGIISWWIFLFILLIVLAFLILSPNTPVEQPPTSSLSPTGNSASESAELYNEAMTLYGAGQCQEALRKWETVLAISQEAANRQYEGKALAGISVSYSCLGNYSQAMEYAQQALMIAIEISDKELESASLYNIGWIYDAQKNYDQAMEYYQQALEIAKSLSNSDLENKILASINSINPALTSLPTLTIIESQPTVSTSYELYQNDKMGLTIVKPKTWSIQESSDRLSVDFIDPQRGIISLMRVDSGRTFDAESVMSVAAQGAIRSSSASNLSYSLETSNFKINDYPAAKTMISGDTKEYGKIDILVVGITTPITSYVIQFVLPSEDREKTMDLYENMIPTIKLNPTAIQTETPAPLLPTPMLKNTPEGFDVFRDEKIGIEILKPRDWVVERKEDRTVGFISTGGIALNMVMISKYEPSGETVEQFIEGISYATMDVLEAKMGALGLIGDMKIDGHSAKNISMTGQTDSGEVIVFVAVVVTSKANYSFVFITAAGADPSAEELFYIMVPTVKLLDEN